MKLVLACSNANHENMRLVRTKSGKMDEWLKACCTLKWAGIQIFSAMQRPGGNGYWPVIPVLRQWIYGPSQTTLGLSEKSFTMNNSKEE